MKNEESWGKVSKFPTEKAACILVEAEFMGDIKAAEKWDVTSRTIRNYRTRLTSDADLLRLFEAKKKLFAESWVDDATAALKAGAKRLKDLFSDGTSDDSFLITAIAGGCKVLGELNITYTALADEPATDSESSET